MTPDPALIVDKAEALVKENRLKDALGLYSTWLKEALRFPQRINPQRDESVAVAYNNRGHLKYMLVDFEGAVQDYNAGLEYNSMLPCLYYNRGTIMYRMGYFGKAVEDMTIAARLAPECPDFQVALQRCSDQFIRVRGQLNSSSDENQGLLNEEANEDEDAEEGSEEQDALAQEPTPAPPVVTSPSAVTTISKKPRVRVPGQTGSSSSPNSHKSEDQGEVTTAMLTLPPAVVRPSSQRKVSGGESHQHQRDVSSASFHPNAKGQGQGQRLSNKSIN